MSLFSEYKHTKRIAESLETGGNRSKSPERSKNANFIHVYSDQVFIS